MGIEIETTEFEEADRRRFQAALEQNLSALADLLAQPGFGAGPASLGAELEMYIVDDQGGALPLNGELHAAAADPQLTLELNQYNLEYNLSPQSLAANAFEATEREMLDKLAALRELARPYGGRIVPIGILPTLQHTDFGPHRITDRKRYHALVHQLLKRRGGRFHIDIDGPEPLKLAMTDITLEGANTSFQVHYRVPPEEFAAMFNAIALATPLALAIGANSPTLFGHRLWQETRIPLFKQSIDTRELDRYGWNEPARVNFGQGWVREGALELFTEAVRIYPPLLPVCAPRTAEEELWDGEVPSLAELRLHQSTVWLWNRPVYDPAGGGHLRIEMRALPAGPTPVDMVANAALLIGLSEGLKPEIDALMPAIPFRIAEYNFYRAAQHGLGAQVLWPRRDQSGYREQPVIGVIRELLPTALAGLERAGVSHGEAAHYLEVIEQRLAMAQTGATWQLRTLDRLSAQYEPAQALRAMLDIYCANSLDNRPVAQWE